MKIEPEGYFRRVFAATQTRFWVNSAIQSDLEFALEAGVVGATFNPTHIFPTIERDGEMWEPVMDGIIRDDPGLDDDEVADRVTQRIAARTARLLKPLYEGSEGELGYAAIQGNPETNDDLTSLLESARRYAELSPNIAVKLPATAAGARALEQLTTEGINTIATMGFSVPQAVAMAEAYERGLRKGGAAPRCFVTVIAGIFDSYLTDLASEQGMDLSPDLVRHAGIAFSREAYRIFEERRYQSLLLGGGVREPHHFTDLVGGGMAITIDAKCAQALLGENPPVVSRIADKIPPSVQAELEEKFPDFRRAYYCDAMAVDEFRRFGPVAAFQRAFLQGYARTIEAVRARRSALGLAASITTVRP